MKKIKEWLIKNGNLLALAFIVIAILYFLTYIFILKQQNTQMQRAMLNMNSGFQEELNNKEEKIFTQMQTILSQRQAIESGLLDVKQLEANRIKSVQAQIRLTEQLKNRDSIIAAFKPETIIKYIDKEGEPDTEHWMKLPAEFNYKDEWLNFSVSIEYPRGLVFNPDQFSLLSKPSITIGYRDKHNSSFRNFFSRPNAVVLYENPSPWVDVVDMDNVIIKEQRSWYRSWWFYMTVGFGVGVFVAN